MEHNLEKMRELLMERLMVLLLANQLAKDLVLQMVALSDRCLVIHLVNGLDCSIITYLVND